MERTARATGVRAGGLRTLELIKHHSLSDWDWPPDNSPVLDDTDYVSPPTSLASKEVSGVTRGGYAFLKNPSNLPYGMFVTWHKEGWNQTCEFMFFLRAQALPPTLYGKPANCYYWRPSNTVSNLQLIVNNSVIYSEHFNHPDPWLNRTWVKLRIMWYPYIEDPLEPQMGIACDRYVDDMWKNQWVYVCDYNQWKDSVVNRVGFSMKEMGTAQSPYWTYVDDTEIWKPKE